MSQNAKPTSSLYVIEAAFTELGWNMTPIHMLRQRLEDDEKAFRAIRKALSRGDWTDVQRMGTAYRIAEEALSGL